MSQFKVLSYFFKNANPFMCGAQKVLNKSLLINYFTVESEIICGIITKVYDYNLALIILSEYYLIT